MKKLAALIAILVFIDHATVSLAQDNKPVKHRIEMIKELIQDAGEATWTDHNGITLLFNQFVQGGSSVTRKTTEGIPRYAISTSFQNSLDQLPPQERESFLKNYEIGYPVKILALNVTFNRNDGSSSLEVRGAYQISLPAEFKRIQLEVNYDVLLDNPEKVSDTEFYVEIYERNFFNQWVKTGEVKNPKIEKARQAGKRLQPTVYTLDNQHFQSYMYNANLSEWAGKEVQVVLTAVTPNNAYGSNGRWTQTRLVGSTFDYKFVKHQ
ncbi:MAG: hypothetical protein JXR73_00290 [Candidatus Omnitrophica bacterium]|nr:hypothetical protein [Candidatus Omnitrophota bacterium]